MKKLKKTALSLPTEQVKKAVMHMRRHCKELVEAKGGLFEK